MQTMAGDRRDRSHEKPNRRIALVWLVLSALLLAIGLQRLMQGQFPDPDDSLRLVQVRDLLAGQNWFDIHQYRIDPPAGVQMHWSRLVDIPIAVLLLVLTPLLGQANAEMATLILVPMLTLGAILFVIGRLAWRLFDVSVAGFTCLSVGLLAPLVFQLQPMRIDHHGWQVFTVALALWAIAQRSALRGGLVAGGAMAAGLSISVEILPMVALFGGVLALRWFADYHQRWWLVGYMQALALGLVAVFLATRGLGELTQYCDAVSPAHLGFFVITAIGTGAIAAAPAVPRAALFALFAFAGAAGLAFFAMSSPTCLVTPFATLDPVVRDYWYVHVLEGRPLWEQELAQALPTFVQLMVGLAGALLLRQRARDWLRQWWGEYALIQLGSIVLALFVWRSAAFAAVIATIPIGWLATRLLYRLRIEDHLLPKLATALATIMLLLPATPVRLWQAMPAQRSNNVGNGQALVRESQCQIRDSAALLNDLPSATVFAPLDIGPSILLKSRQSVVATGHHRAERAMHDVITAFTSPPEKARAIMTAHGASYVAMCTDLAEAGMYAEMHPRGLAAQLVAGKAPDWLVPVPLDAPAQFKVWRVLR